MWVGESPFWYRPTRVVPDQRPLNGRCCCCCCFRITINFTTFRTISGTFESTSGFWTVLVGYRFRFGHPVFLLKAFLAVHVRYGDNTGQNKAKNSVQGALEAKPEVGIWRRPVFLTQRRLISICPKVGQSTQLVPVLQIHFRFEKDDFLHSLFELRSISRHFGHFWKYFRFLNCTSGLQI